MRHIVASVSILIAIACVSAPLPPSKVAETESIIVAAETMGAADHPKAEMHLKFARDQLQQAKMLSDAGAEDRARLTLGRARLDAELALVLTREAKAESQSMRSRKAAQSIMPERE